jgi:hypothetical protein
MDHTQVGDFPLDPNLGIGSFKEIAYLPSHF